MQTATNPQTGEKVQWNGQSWVPMGAGQPAGQPQMPAQQPGVQVVGTPRPKPPQIRQVGSSLGVVDDRGNFTPTYTPPKEPEKPKPLARITPSAAGGIQENMKSLRSVDAAIAALKSRPGSIGPGTGALGDTFTQFNDPEGTDTRATLGKVAAYKIHDLSGAAVSASESPRFVPFIPSATDRPEVAEAKLKRFKEELSAVIKEQLAFYTEDNGYMPYQTPEVDAFLNPPAEQMGPEQVRAEIIRRSKENADPHETIAWLISQGVNPSKEDVAAIFANRGNQNPDVSVERVDPNAEAFKAGLGDVAEFAGDTLGLIGNPLNAGINAVAGTNLSTDLGQTFRDASGMPQGNPMASAINQGGLAALGGAGIARGVAPMLSGAGREVANTIAAEPIRQGVAGMGAGAGSEAARKANLGPAGQFAGGVIGGLAGYGGANAMMRFSQPKTSSPLIQDAKSLGIDLRAADVSGPTMRRIDSAAAQSAFSANSIGKAARKTQDQMGGALKKTARAEGDILPEDEAGESLVAPLKGYSQKQAQRIGRVYERAEQRASGVKIKPNQAVGFLDEQIARFKDAPMGDPIASELQSIRDKIVNGVSVSGMRDARSILSQGVYDGKLRSGQQKGIYKQFLGLLSKDIEAGLSAAGRKDALNLFRIADKAWADRISYVDDVLEPVIGRAKSGEDVLTSIENMGKGKSGGVRRLTEVLRELPPEQAGNIRATVIDRLGRATAGNQGASGDTFSANTFLTNWNKMSGKGKAAMFGNADLRQNLDKLARVAEATAETGRFANFSNTGGAISNNIMSMAAVGGAAQAITGGYGIQTFGALAGAQLLTGKLLASPRFTAWLAKVPANPRMMERHEGQLAQIAAREPIIANDIASIQQYLSSATQRAAASPKDQSEDSR